MHRNELQKRALPSRRLIHYSCGELRRDEFPRDSPAQASERALKQMAQLRAKISFFTCHTGRVPQASEPDEREGRPGVRVGERAFPAPAKEPNPKVGCHAPQNASPHCAAQSAA